MRPAYDEYDAQHPSGKPIIYRCELLFQVEKEAAAPTAGPLSVLSVYSVNNY